MSKHLLKKRVTGLLTALLVLSMPLQSFGATTTGMRGSSSYINQTGQTSQTDSASSAEVLKQLREIPAFDAAFYAETYPDAAAAFGKIFLHFIKFIHTIFINFFHNLKHFLFRFVFSFQFFTWYIFF